LSPEGAMICLHRGSPVKKDVISVALKGRYPPPQGEALCIIGDKKHPPCEFSRDLN